MPAAAWSGSWRVTLHRDPVGRTTWTGGFGHEGLTWSLGPGEALDTPVFAGLYTAGGFGAASRAWHGYVRRHVLSHPDEVADVLGLLAAAEDFVGETVAVGKGLHLAWRRTRRL